MRKLLSLGKINQEINSVEKIIIPVETEDFLEKKIDLEGINNQVMVARRQMENDPTLMVEDLILVDIEVEEDPTLVVEVLMVDTEVEEDPTLVAEVLILVDTEVEEDRILVDTEVEGTLEPQEAVVRVKKRIIRAEERMTTVQAVEIVKNKTELSFIKQ